jgi:hypothetical protein
MGLLDEVHGQAGDLDFGLLDRPTAGLAFAGAVVLIARRRFLAAGGSWLRNSLEAGSKNVPNPAP